jgi:sucrose-6-phosphate hydrolase SacC (GH32 family)
VITDQIFPDPDARGVRLFSKGGQARLTRLAAWDMKSYRR